MSRFPTTTELAHEALEALQRSQESPADHFQRLIRLGWINSQGEVTRLLGGDAEPEMEPPASDLPTPEVNGHS
jgi:hypothetical protein